MRHIRCTAGDTSSLLHASEDGRELGLFGNSSTGTDVVCLRTDWVSGGIVSCSFSSLFLRVIGVEERAGLISLSRLERLASFSIVNMSKNVIIVPARVVFKIQLV